MSAAPPSNEPEKPAADVPLYRTFVTDEKDRPKIGIEDFMLGARVPIDIKPDRDGMVRPGIGGMSVTPNDPSGLPPHLRPISLAGGQSTLPVFVIGASDLGPSLRFQRAKRHPERHGYVEPAMAMKLEAYQNALGSTVSEWVPWRAAA
ncbi:MAG: hypothetical protein ACRENE_12715 [Polyangiaceae bacterium]